MILIVRHGPKRGRDPRYNQSHLRAVRRRDPALYRRLRFYETGAPPPSLDGVDAVVFWLGDPLRELYPDCYADAMIIADAARARGLTVINPPEALSNTTKSVQSGLWRAAGIPTPPYTRCEDRDTLRAQLETADLPHLVRRDEKHGQRPTRICRRRAEAAALAEEWPHFPCSIAPLVDVRQMYRDAGHDDIWSRYHHVRRAAVFGSAVLNENILLAESPIVCVATSLHREWEKGPFFRREFGPLSPDLKRCLQAEADFWATEADCRDLMLKAAATLGLQYLAFDYCRLPDDKIILWEANPYFLMAPINKRVLWRKRNFRQHYDVLDRALAGFLRSLLNAAPAPPPMQTLKP